MRPPRVFGKKLSVFRFTDLEGQGQAARQGNAFGAVKAIGARLALHGDGRHQRVFGQVVATHAPNGGQHVVEYMETSPGGLAVNLVER
jgi:hypothetical protein